MEKTRQEVVIEKVLENSHDQEQDLRTLKDLELMFVGGGGDDAVGW